MTECDVCIIGSGAGGSPIALELSAAGYDVVVLEKGPFLTQADFYKDELACCRRSVYTPNLQNEFHVIEDYDGSDEQGKQKWSSESTYDSGWDFWNGNMVGGSSNVMSGYFYRLKPQDFHLRSEYGPIKGANVVDWPISYADLEPYYSKVEHVVGISGEVRAHPQQEPRSTKDFPYPPTQEHALAQLIDKTCVDMKLHPLCTARAILSKPLNAERRSCEYSGYCGSYGCASGAKGSAREALLNVALTTGKCRIIARAKVNRLISNTKGEVTHAEYVDATAQTKTISARIFVVACQAVETSRLLLLSRGVNHEQGLGNQHGQVGKNMLFSAGGSGYGEFPYERMSEELAAQYKVRGPFINRGLQDWYEINDTQLGRVKGGTVDFLLRHPNPINRAAGIKRDDNDRLVWGSALKQQLHAAFTETQSLRYEIFCDWLPTDDCFVSLDNSANDQWGVPVAKLRIGYHDHDLAVGEYILQHCKQVLTRMGASSVSGSVSGSPPANLQAGGCRFGREPKTSVLDPDCRIHTASNVFVTDGSWMPTGGSVPYTWTIYANAFRVADIIKKQI